MATLPTHTEAAAREVVRVPIAFVNVYLVGAPDTDWLLVDTGLPGGGAYLRQVCEQQQGRPPAAIVLTHAHFDHAGNALALAEAWDVPIYVHAEELPFVTGRSAYPPSDSSMGGAIAQMARLFPTSGFDFGARVRVLPADGSVPVVAGWRWVHTPGHTAGHVSLWREEDRTLIAGDALATMDMDSWAAHLTHARELARPAAPFTPDWDASKASIRKLAELDPATIGAGHGRVMSGSGLAAELRDYALLDHRPAYGRYVEEPAHYDPQRGVVSVPPPVTDRALAPLLAGVAVVGAVALLVASRRRWE